MLFSSNKQNIYVSLGITLIELVMVLAILAIMASIAIPTYQGAIKKADITKTLEDFWEIELRIQKFITQYHRLPIDAVELGGLPVDPWGNPYVYLNIGMAKGKGKLRKDKNLVPINTDYDLYSKGPDGKSVSPLTAKASRDDIIRANNGGYIGVAEDY